jgi:TPR repeat protein
MELALCFFRSVEIEQSFDSGMIWLRRAVVQNHSTAQAILGGSYMKGERVPLDTV